MKAILFGAAALLFTAGAQQALAQQEQPGGPPGAPPQGRHPPAQAPGAHQGAAPPQGAPHGGPGYRGGPGQPPPQHQPQPSPPPQTWQRGNRPGGPTWAPNAPSPHQPPAPGAPPEGRQGRQPPPPGAGPQTWTRGPNDRWREEGGHPPGPQPPPAGAAQWGPHRYPPVYRSQQRFRTGPWYPPPGYYSRAWRYGEILPRTWFTADYLLGDWWDFGLPAPPPGYDWVRVGADALLIDSYSGQIVQVVQGVFW